MTRPENLMPLKTICRRFAWILICLECLLWTGFSLRADTIPVWHIQKAEGDAWIIGSVHALKDDIYPLPQGMTELVSRVDTLAVEVNILALDQDRVRKTVQNLGMYPLKGRKTLLTELHPDTLRQVSTYLDERGQRLGEYQRMRPWFLNMTIGVQELNQRQMKLDSGVDLFLMRIARSKGVKIVELESFEEQMRLLASDPLSIQELGLKSTLDNLHLIDSYLRDLMALWRKGDADGLLRLSRRDLAHYPLLKASFERLIDQRNRAMAVKIEHLLERQENLLIVVGAMHLGGESGLLQFLRSKYPLRQLNEEESK